MEALPSRELTCPTLGKENQLQEWFLVGYVSSQEGMHTDMYSGREATGKKAHALPKALEVEK